MGRKDSKITVLPQEKGGYAAELKKSISRKGILIPFSIGKSPGIKALDNCC